MIWVLFLLEGIRALHQYLGISADILIQPYSLV
jgi:hypothetical protein